MWVKKQHKEQNISHNFPTNRKTIVDGSGTKKDRREIEEKKTHEIWKTERELKTLFSKGHNRFEWEIFMDMHTSSCV